MDPVGLPAATLGCSFAGAYRSRPVSPEPMRASEQARPWATRRPRAGRQIREKVIPLLQLEVTTMDQPRPFPLDPDPIHVADEVLADLGRRLARTRWFEDAGNDDWYYGVDGAYLRELVDYWRDGFD